MKAVAINYAGPETGGHLTILYETKEGLRFTPEQWRLTQMMDRLEKKIDTLMVKLGEKADKS